jgi:hypothetical protein
VDPAQQTARPPRVDRGAVRDMTLIVLSLLLF